MEMEKKGNLWHKQYMNIMSAYDIFRCMLGTLSDVKDLVHKLYNFITYFVILI